MIEAVIGGVIIGIAVSVMLAFNGRIAGISGIVSGILTPKKGDFSWRVFFLLGLLSGGGLLMLFRPEAFVSLSKNMHFYDYIFAGFVVGVGTLMGNGCTSGHGVCGISRFSIRSLFATGTFIFFGIISVAIFKWLRGDL